mgnify:CR=1 FL=1
MNSNSPETERPVRKGRLRIVFFSVIVPLVILAGGVFVAMLFMKTSPKAVPRQKPVFETLPGWPEDISGIKKLADLPVYVRKYLDRIAELTQTPIDIISVGADRDQTIVLKNPFI